MHVAFPTDTFNKLIAYLGNKPFNEVEDLMTELKAKIQPVEVNFPPKPETLTPEPIKEGGDGDNVLSTQTESQQETQPSQEGGIQGVQEEPQSSS